MRAPIALLAAVLLTWNVDTYVVVPCPQPPPDQYTGEASEIMPAVACSERRQRAMRRGFDSRADAVTFSMNGPLSCSDWKIDGKPITPEDYYRSKYKGLGQ